MIEELKKMLAEAMETEMENWRDASKSAGYSCPGANQALGEMEAYRQVLIYIEELESELTET